MQQLKDIREKELVENKENRRSIKREPRKIRKFFSNIYDSLKGDVKIEDIKLDHDEFVRYVRIVSNSEIELVHGGNDSELQKHVKMLWKTLAEEVKTVTMEQEQDKGSKDEGLDMTQE